MSQNITHYSSNDPLVSVIIPVYMVQEYLDQCIKSVVNQTYKNLEIILVNDGSKDKSPEICERWKELDHRIRVIHKDNGGLSSARNAGLKVATGFYVAFLDSDDWLHPDCYRTVVNRAISTNADVVGYDIFESYSNETIYNQHIPTFPKEVFNAVDYLPILFNMWPLVWAKLYKKDFITRNNLKFIEGILYEDNPFILGCWIRNPVVTFVKEPLHYYRLGRNGQITFGHNPKTKDVFTMLDKVREDFQKTGMIDHYINLVDWSIQNVVWPYHKTPYDLRNDYFKQMKKLFLSYILKGMCRPGVVKRKNAMSLLKVIFLPQALFK